MCSTSQAALTFNLNPAGGMSQQAIDGFTAAGNVWSNLLTDSVTINIDIDYTPLGPGILGSANSTRQTFTYAATRAALVTDATSSDDSTATSHLPAGSSFNLAVNYTNNSPHGVGSATVYLDNDGDANNSTMRMTTANAKALGLISATDPASDASISFSSSFSWDFDASNGITPGSYDFVGVAVHEIGHALGFISGVDILDLNSPNGSTYYNDSVFTYVSPLDLYRYSATSYAYAASTIDWSANNTAKYFSIDGGATALTTFSTGTSKGDGQQASHWKDSLGIGIMDPTAASGEALSVSSLDERGFDVIGWDLASSGGGGGGGGMPEPGSLGWLAGAMALWHLTGRRQRWWRILP